MSISILTCMHRTARRRFAGVNGIGFRMKVKADDSGAMRRRSIKNRRVCTGYTTTQCGDGAPPAGQNITMLAIRSTKP